MCNDPSCADAKEQLTQQLVDMRMIYKDSIETDKK